MQMLSLLIEKAKAGNSLETRECLQAGISPNTRDVHGETALTWAAHLGHTAVVKDLLAAGANCELKGNLLQAPPLVLAARGGHRGCLALLAVHADPDARDPFGATALMLAVEKYEPTLKPQHRILAMVQTLLAADAPVNSQDENGDTALMWAIRWQNPEVIEMLLDAGVDPTLRSKRGWNAIEMADARGQVELVAQLEQALKNRQPRPE